MASAGGSDADAAADATADAAALASANAERARFHATLAETQWRALADALDAPTPEPPSACALRASVKAFVATHGRLPGSGPFLRGLRGLLEAQGGKPRVVAWRLDPATLTQSGGEAWMRDAVLLLRSGLERREDLEGPPAPAVPPAPASDERQPLPAHLVWSLPAHVSDVDLYKILAKLPDHAVHLLPPEGHGGFAHGGKEVDREHPQGPVGMGESQVEGGQIGGGGLFDVVPISRTDMRRC